MFRFVIFHLLLFANTLVFAAELIDMKHSQTKNWEKQLRTGQILTTESTDPLQLFTLLGAEKFSPFVHLGVVEVDGSDIYIYDTTSTIGKYYLEGKSPSDTMKGEVRRLKLQDFLNYATVINIFSTPATINTEKLMSFVKHHWKIKTPFDPYFSINEHSKLYCSEFIALALEQAGAGKYAPATMRHNPSLDVVRRWMKINTPRFIFPYQLVKPRNWLGTISLNFNSHSLIIDRLIKFELYRRFTHNQKIGNVLQQSGTSITVRESVKRFAQKAHSLLASEVDTSDNLTQRYQSVRKIADQVLGKAENTPEQPLPLCQLDLRLCATL